MKNEKEESQYSRPFLDSEVELNEYQSVDDERNQELFTSFDAVNRNCFSSHKGIFSPLKIMKLSQILDLTQSLLIGLLQKITL